MRGCRRFGETSDSFILDNLVATNLICLSVTSFLCASMRTAMSRCHLWYFAPKFWEVVGTYERYFVILWMEVQWWGYHEVVWTLKPYAKEFVWTFVLTGCGDAKLQVWALTILCMPNPPGETFNIFVCTISLRFRSRYISRIQIWTPTIIKSPVSYATCRRYPNLNLTLSGSTYFSTSNYYPFISTWSYTKIPTLPVLCITGKLEWQKTREDTACTIILGRPW